MTFADRLKSMRTEHKLTQITFAKKLGVTPGLISAWENERCGPSNLMLCCLADYFGVSTDYLLGRMDKQC